MKNDFVFKRIFVYKGNRARTWCITRKRFNRGKNREKEIAKAMLKEKVSLEFISKVTGLSKEEIKKFI